MKPLIMYINNVEERDLLRSILLVNIEIDWKECIGKTISEVLESDLNPLRGNYVLFSDNTLLTTFQYPDKDRAIHELSRYSYRDGNLTDLGKRLVSLGIINQEQLIKYWQLYEEN